MSRIAIVLTTASAFTCLAAQTVSSDPAAAPGPKFEVSSVRPAFERTPAAAGAGTREGGGGSRGGCRQSLRIDPGRVDIQCITLTALIGHAFRLSPDRVKGPDWMNSASFDIAAKIPESASQNQVPEMLQALLVDRFKLATHRSASNQPIYALVVAKGGLKIKSADSAGIVRESSGPDRLQRWEAPGITMEGLADLLDRVTPFFSAPVLDMTGLNGRYSLVLEVSLKDLGDRTPLETEDAVLHAFNDGLRKLGLQLARRKGPVESIFVDHVEKTPSENQATCLRAFESSCPPHSVTLVLSCDSQSAL